MYFLYVQAVFQNVYKLLNQTCEQLLQASNSLADAVHLVRSYLAPSKVQKDTPPHVIYNNVSPYVFPVSSAVCTTPPLDEPSAMEITESESVIIEINDTIMNNLNRGQCTCKMILGLQMQMAINYYQLCQVALCCLLMKTDSFLGFVFQVQKN